MNYQRLNILAIGFVLVLIPAITLGFITWKVLILLFLVYSITLGWGVFDIGSQFFMPTFWRGEKGTVSFTFDDGPDPEVTPKVLDVLREEGVKAAFFVIGRNAEKHPKLVKQILDEGHVVGNHTYNHAYVFSTAAAEKQVTEGQEVIEKIIGKKPAYFRPPFGVMNPKIADAVMKERCAIIGWDLRSQDGRIRTKEATIKRISSHLLKSTVLLFHDTNPTTPDALREIIHLCRQNGMKIVSVPEQSGIAPYHA
ncbi:MAG: polysaccharide deacetylase family protein [Flavobacteriales bacterium]|nr:polysaccharide deacetylase family protein [Flavobacteriales bacterium]